MKALAMQCSNQVARVGDLRRTWRIWLRGLLKTAVHSGSGTLLAGLGTNGVEAMAPVVIQPYVDGMAMQFNQCVAVFGVSAFLSALKYVHETTAPGTTNPPMNP